MGKASHRAMRNMVKMLSDTGPPEECEGKYASQLVPNQTPWRRRAFFTGKKDRLSL